MRLAARERIPDAARERPERGASVQRSGGPYEGCVFAERQSDGNDGRKAAGDNMLHVRAVDRHRMSRRAMDFAAFVGRLLGAMMMLRPVCVVRRGPVIAHVVCGYLGLDIHPGLRTLGIGCGKQARLESRHDQKYDRQQCPERYVS